MIENYKKLGLDALVVIGGDGSMDIAQKLSIKCTISLSLFSLLSQSLTPSLSPFLLFPLSLSPLSPPLSPPPLSFSLLSRAFTHLSHFVAKGEMRVVGVPKVNHPTSSPSILTI